MNGNNEINSFLVDLLSLQQDGKQAISAPTNWIQEPLLEVKTEVDEIVEELLEAMLVGSEGNKTARWHFFIGSPGNGKSAAMGKLCRQLMFLKECRVCDENNVTIDDLPSTVIPYAINVYENNNKYSSAQIVQDASVVRNPFSSDIDPATELVETLNYAWDKGISLIICTNRGVLEKAHRDNHTKKETNSKPWFKILSAIVLANTSLKSTIEKPFDFNGKKTVFSRVLVGFSHLDNRSLLMDRDTFNKLLSIATSPDHWELCNSCSAADMCPFKANCSWLLNEEARAGFLKILTRAEVMSGQVIVFREALAIISLILAGCPRDYGERHPCEWVQETRANNDIYSLAVRRIYMCLFASYSPHGLEYEDILRRKQLNALRWLFEVMDEENTQARGAIECVIKPNPPSTDVGVKRILGAQGILANLDPCMEGLPSEFYQRWDSDYEAVIDSAGDLFTEIELTCLLVWKELEECLELASEYSGSEAHWALRRWSSNFLLHFGALFEGLSAWSEELDDFAGLLELIRTAPENRSSEQKRSIRKLNILIENLLNTVAGNQEESSVQLSEAVTLSGLWVRNKLKPKTIANEESGSVSLAVEFEGGERAKFAAPMYLWLTRRAGGKLDPRCFPQELLTGAIDARVRAASKGKYAFENDEVELVIRLDNDELFRLIRVEGGEVDVSHE